jgi:hypothetical protein
MVGSDPGPHAAAAADGELAALSLNREVTSLRQALVLIGPRRLRSWVVLTLLEGGTTTSSSDDLWSVLARAFTCQRLGAPQADLAFTVGLLSGAAELLGVDAGAGGRRRRRGCRGAVRAAGRRGPAGRALTAVLAHEADDAEAIAATGLLPFDVSRTYLEALSESLELVHDLVRAAPADAEAGPATPPRRYHVGRDAGLRPVSWREWGVGDARTRSGRTARRARRGAGGRRLRRWRRERRRGRGRRRRQGERAGRGRRTARRAGRGEAGRDRAGHLQPQAGGGTVSGDADVVSGAGKLVTFTHQVTAGDSGPPVKGRLLAVGDSAFERSSRWKLPSGRKWFAVNPQWAAKPDEPPAPEWLALVASRLLDPRSSSTRRRRARGRHVRARRRRRRAGHEVHAGSHLGAQDLGPELTAWAKQTGEGTTFAVSLWLDAGHRPVRLKLDGSTFVMQFWVDVTYHDYGADVAVKAPDPRTVAKS